MAGPRHVVPLAAAVLVTAAAGVVAMAPARAATCSGTSGVSVVVDFHQLGGGVQTACDANGAGKYAAAQFADVGHTLTQVQGQAFVCRVDGKPASDPCVHTPPANAYWSLWWSDGKSGTWSYSSAGAWSLKVPAGGYVALSWQKGTKKAKPGVTPTAHTSASPSPSPSRSPKPSSSPKPSPSSHPSSHPPSPRPSQQPGGPASQPTSHSATGSSSQVPGTRTTNGPSAGAGPGATASGSRGSGNGPAKATPDPTGASSPGQSQADGALGQVTPSASSSDSGSGLPWWVPPVVVVLVFAAAAFVVVRRRGSGGA